MVILVGALFVMTTENSKPLNVLTRFVAAVICADTPDGTSASAGGGVAELLGDFSPQPAIKIAAAIITVKIEFFIKYVTLPSVPAHRRRAKDVQNEPAARFRRLGTRFVRPALPTVYLSDSSISFAVRSMISSIRFII